MLLGVSVHEIVVPWKLVFPSELGFVLANIFRLVSSLAPATSCLEFAPR